MNILNTTLGLILLTSGGEYIPLDQVSKIPTPNLTPLECGIERVVDPSTYIGAHNLSNGLEAHTYDTSGDGVMDVQIMLPQGDENRHPLFYMFDRPPYDGEPNVVYKDTLRDGSCKGIEVVYSKGDTFEPRKEA